MTEIDHLYINEILILNKMDKEMDEETYSELKEFVSKIANTLSNQEEESFHYLEGFTYKKIIPVSEQAATVIYQKESGEKALAFFYLISGRKNEGWKYFFPTKSHILGFLKFLKYQMEID